MNTETKGVLKRLCPWVPGTRPGMTTIFSKEAVRVDVDGDPDGARRLHAGAPGGHVGGEVHAAVGADQEALAAAAADQAERGVGGAVDLDAFGVRRDLGHAA